MNESQAEAVVADLEKKNVKELTENMQEIRSMGLANMALLCTVALKKKANPQLEYVLFSILASLLHPLTPSDKLKELIESLLPLSNNTEEVRYVRVSFAKCMATALFHLLSPDNVELVTRLLGGLEPSFAVLFLAELCVNLKRALDVPMFSTVTYIVVTRVLPMFLDTLMDAFFQAPAVDILDMITFYVTYLKEDKLADLAKQQQDASCDVQAISGRLREVISARLIGIPELLQRQTLESARTHVLNFVSRTVHMGLDPKILIGVVNSILKMEIDNRIIGPVLDMVKTVQMKYYEWEPGDELFHYVGIVGLAAAEQNNMSILRDVLSCLSAIPGAKEVRGIPGAHDPRVSTMIAPWLAKQIASPCEDEDDEQGLYDDVCESEAYLSQGNPEPCFQVVIGAFQDGIDLSTCHWCLKLLNNFCNSYKEFEHPCLPQIEQGLRTVVSSPIIWEYGSNSSDIALELCRTFLLINEPQGALKTFHMVLAKYGDDETVVREGLQVARRYHFPIENIAAQGLPMTNRLLQTAVSLAPSPSVLVWIKQLMDSGQEAQLCTAAYLVRGLLDAEHEIDTQPFIAVFVEKHMFCEALKVAYTNAEYCCQILNTARQWSTDIDTRRQLLLTALRISFNLCDPNVTNMSLQFLIPELIPDLKVSKYVASLLHEHAIRGVPILQEAAVVMVSFLSVWLSSETVVLQIFENTLKAMSFAFELVYPLLSNEQWGAIITVILSESTSMDSDLLFKFAATDYDRYSAIIAQVFSKVGNAEPLMLLLHRGVISSGSDTEQMKLYQQQLAQVAKTYQYLKSYL